MIPNGLSQRIWLNNFHEFYDLMSLISLTAAAAKGLTVLQ